MKKLSLFFLLVAILVCAGAFFVPSIVERTVRDRLYNSFVGSLTLDTISGVDYSLFRGFHIDDLKFTLYDEWGSYGIELKNSAFGVAPQSILKSNDAIVLSYFDIDTIVFTSDREQGSSDLTLFSIFDESIQKIGFSNHFSLKSDCFIWSGPSDSLLLTSLGLNRRGERDFQISYHEALMSNFFISEYLQIDIYGMTNGTDSSLKIIDTIAIDSLLPHDTTIAILNGVSSAVEQLVESKIEYVDSAMIIANRLYGETLRQFQFDSLKIQNASSTVRNNDSSLTECMLFDLLWDRTGDGDSLEIEVAKIRNSNWPRIDSLSTSVRIADGTVPDGSIQFEVAGIQLTSTFELPQSLDSGTVVVLLENRRESYIHYSQLPIRFDTLNCIVDGSWRDSGWTVDLVGSLEELVVDNYITDSTLKIPSLIIDTLTDFAVTLSDSSVGIGASLFSGAINSSEFHAEQLLFNRQDRRFRADSLIVVPYLESVAIDTVKISTIVLEQDSGMRLSLQLDSLFVIQSSDSLWWKTVDTQLYDSSKTLHWIDSIAMVSCNVIRIGTDSTECFMVDSLTIANSGVFDIAFDTIAICSVGSLGAGAVTVEWQDSVPKCIIADLSTVDIVHESFSESSEILTPIRTNLINSKRYIGSPFAFTAEQVTLDSTKEIKDLQLLWQWDDTVLQFECIAQSILYDTTFTVKMVDAYGKLSVDRVILDSSNGTWGQITGGAKGWVNLEPPYQCSLRTYARNLPLSPIASEILSNHGRVTGYGSGKIIFMGQLFHPQTWHGDGSFLLKNVRVRELSVQQGDVINKHAVPFKDIRMDMVVCSAFELFRGQKMHLKDVRGTGSAIDFHGWGNLSRKGYFYFEMDGKVHRTTMDQLPRLTRLALNEKSEVDEGEFTVKLFGSPNNQELVPERGLGGKVIRSQFRAIGASIRNFFE